MVTQKEIIDLVEGNYSAKVYREYSNPPTYIEMNGVDISLYPEFPLNFGLNILYENLVGCHLKHPKTIEPDTNFKVKGIDIEAPANYRVFVEQGDCLKEFLDLTADKRNLYPVKYLEGEIIDLKKEEFDEEKFLKIVNSFHEIGDMVLKMDERKEAEEKEERKWRQKHNFGKYESWLKE